QTASGLTWGGYDNYVTDNTREQNVKISNGGLHFEPRMVNESIGYYGYTSWVGIKPSLDMTGAAIDFMASSESVPTDLGTDVEILLRAGGVWYVSDSVVNIKDDVSDTKKPYSFDLATTTWTAVDTATNTMLDNLLNGGGDEGPLVLGTPAAGAPDLSDVTGGGFRGASDPGNNDDVKIDDIVWDQNPLLNIDPLVTINGKETDVRYAHIVTYSSSTDTKPLLNWDEFTDGDGWQAINNAKATDGDGDPLTYTWAVTDYVGTDAPSEQEAIDNVLFRRNNRDEATDVIDPNIIYPYRGTYTVTLTAEDSEASDVATLTQHVVTNRAPRVVNVAGDNSREVYAGDTIEKLNPTIRDDNYPLTDPLTTQQFSVISGPAPLSFNFNGVTTTDSFEGIGKTHPLIPERQPEDPNVTFPAGFVGVYEIRIQAHDGELGSWQSATDLEQIVTVTVIDNKAMTAVDAGEDQIASLLAGGQITLEGSITDPDP
ncbi:MAG: hypothetical protein KAT00_05850, partial [Planctomycetes bacterium]|nr:hypothetical protein [Planctomycetota bacterium]